MECSGFNAHSLYIERVPKHPPNQERSTEVHKEQAIQTIIEKMGMAKKTPKDHKQQKHENKKQTLFKHY